MGKYMSALHLYFNPSCHLNTGTLALFIIIIYCIVIFNSKNLVFYLYISNITNDRETFIFMFLSLFYAL